MNTTYSSFTSLATLFSTKRYEQSPVSYDRDTVITWGDFQKHVATLAQQLETQPTQNIALCFGNSYLFAVGFLLVVTQENPLYCLVTTNQKHSKDSARTTIYCCMMPMSLFQNR